VQGQRQLDHAKIRSQMTAGLGQRLDQKVADLLGERGHLRVVQALQVCGRLNRVEDLCHA